MKDNPCQLFITRKFLFCITNGIFLLYTFLSIFQYEGIIQSLCINAILFALPGIALYGLIRKQKPNLIDGIACCLGAAALLIVGFIVLQTVFRFPVSNFTFLIWIVAVSNMLIVVTKRKSIVCAISAKNFLIYVVLFLSVYIFSYIGGTYRISYLIDSDIERSGTSYGLIHHGKPYLLTDRNSSFFYAHPLLMNLYSASTILLSGHLDDMKVYYDHAVERLEILAYTYKKGEVIRFFDMYSDGQFFTIDKVTDGKIIFTKNSPKEITLFDVINRKGVHPLGYQSISIDMLNTLRIENSLNNMERSYMNNPNFLYGRMALYFLFAITCLMIFLIIFKLSDSYLWSMTGVLVYVTIPEVYIWSSAGIFTSIINVAMIVLVYYYLFGRDCRERLFLAGLLCAISSQKTIILPISIALWEIIRQKRINWQSLKTSLFHKSVLGFIAGIAIYWMYGLVTNPDVFLVEHIRYHFFNRIFHINELGYDSYPSILGLWKDFIHNFGPSFFILSTIFLMGHFLTHELPKREKTGILFVWFFIGAIVYSIVDWRVHYHLLLIVPPLVIGGIQFISQRTKWTQSVFFTLCICTIMINVIKLCGLLSSDFLEIFQFLKI